MRINEVWELNGLTSLKYVQQAVAGRAGETIAVRLTPEPVPEWRQAAAAARAAVAAAGGDSSDSEGELTAQERAELLSQLEQLDSRAKQAKQVRVRCACRWGRWVRRAGCGWLQQAKQVRRLRLVIEQRVSAAPDAAARRRVCTAGGSARAVV